MYVFNAVTMKSFVSFAVSVDFLRAIGNFFIKDIKFGKVHEIFI